MTILHRFRKDCRVILYIEDVDLNIPIKAQNHFPDSHPLH